MNTQIKILPILIIALIASIAWFIKPDAVQIHSWHTLIIFISTIISIILNVMPLGAIGLVSITIFALTSAAGAVSSKKAILDALSGFNSDLVWLIVIAFFIAKGFIKTGLGQRIAFFMIKFFGKRTLGLAYALSLADLILAPATPSNTARCGGVIYPIAEALSKSFQSYPHDESRKKIGAYLMTSIGNVNDITATLFITAYAANPLIVNLAGEFGVNLTWGNWFIAALVPALVSLFFVPIALYFIMKPHIKETPQAHIFARQELVKMGNMSCNEMIMGFTFIGLLGLWIFGAPLGIHATTTALIGLSTLIMTGILTWDDIKGEKAAWDTLVWLSALLMMADFLNKLGFMKWFGNVIGNELHFMTSLHWVAILIILNIVYTYTHYFFASGVAQVAALYSVFLGVGVHLGIPVYPLALLLGFSSSLYCSLTHYTHTRSVILFDAGYVTKKEWWRAGFIINFLNQIIFVVVGLAWWKLVGFY